MKQNLRDVAYNEIKGRITCLGLKPGERIFDVEIAKELGISRTPVREALLVLERERLVECSGSSGYVVRKLSTKEADEYFALRELLETYAAKLMIDGVTPEVLKAIRAKIAESERCAREDDLQGVMRCNTEIHDLFYQATGSEVFVNVMSSVSDKFQWLRAVSLSSGKGFQEALDDHRRILAALEGKDLEALQAAIRSHLDHAQEKYLSVRKIVF